MNGVLANTCWHEACNTLVNVDVTKGQPTVTGVFFAVSGFEDTYSKRQKAAGTEQKDY